jgi:CRISPR-associated endonuclease Csn1
MTTNSSFELPPKRDYILGLDIGANSIGWVCLAAEPVGTGFEPTGLLHPPSEMHRWPTLGVRIFPEGVANFDTGDEEGPGVQRRRMRLMRRQTMRRARRMKKTFRMLQRAGLLPDYAPDAIERHGGAEEAARDELVKSLDAQLSARWAARLPADQQARAHDTLPYLLRARGLDEALDATEVGRAFYHLAQRRGFLSNRKDAEATRGKKPAKGSDDDPTALKAQMDELSAAMQNAGHRSLGEHLYHRLDVRDAVRKLKTRRHMYRREFELLWSAQAKHHPQLLTEDLRKRLYLAIFFQRPLKDQSDKIGLCSLEDGQNQRIDPDGRVRKTYPQRRAPVCDLLFQRFRALQRVNDVRVLSKATGEVRPLSADERATLLKHLESVKSMTAKEVAKQLGWGTKLQAQINFDDETGKALSGLWTHAQLRAIFGERWDGLAADAKDAVVGSLFHDDAPDWYEDDPDAPDERDRDPAVVRLALSGQGVWAKLQPTRAEAQRLIGVQLSPAYASLSRKAIRRLLPEMEAGLQYKHVADRCYRIKQSQVLDYLPPVEKVFRSVNNPVVTRSLTELRRVMEHLLKLYGKPVQIRLELARDVHQGRKGRESARDAQRENIKLKSKAVEQYCLQIGIAAKPHDNFRSDDLVRLRLWVEQEFTCPYTSRTISASQVLTAVCEVDHILPFSRSQDDSYGNKVLCFAEANAKKGPRLPSETWGDDVEVWARLRGWVQARRKKSSMSPRKLDKLLFSSAEASEYLDNFRARQLNDTRWAATWAKRYLMHLYGGDVGQGVDPHGRRRILVSGGAATAHLRKEKGIDKILKRVVDPAVPLPPRGFTKRIDHRHHAIDAFSVAWCGPKMHAAMSRAAEAAPDALRRFYDKLEDPWAEWEQDLEAVLRACVPSHRVSARARGALHKETIYSPATVLSGERKSNLVVGAQSHRRRNMDHSGNHHVVVRVKDGDGAQAIEVEVVSKFEAIARVQRGRLAANDPATGQQPGALKGQIGGPFVRGKGTYFTASIGDVLRVPSVGEAPPWFGVVRILQQDGRVVLCPIHETRTPRTLPPDARASGAQSKFFETNISNEGLRLQLRKLIELGCRKFTITPIGIVRPSRA